jgi:hypothetical protein
MLELVDRIILRFIDINRKRSSRFSDIYIYIYIYIPSDIISLNHKLIEYKTEVKDIYFFIYYC